MVKNFSIFVIILSSFFLVACSTSESSESSPLHTIKLGGVNYFPTCLDKTKKDRCLLVTVLEKNAKLKDFLGRQSAKSFAKEQGVPESSINENTPLPAGDYMVYS